MNVKKLHIRRRLLAAGAAALAAPMRALAQPAAPLRILHVMSYHSPWRWTDGQLAGFKEALQGVPVEVRVFQMDAKRNSTPAQKEAVGRKAREMIDAWRPDLLYTSDDDAQEFVAAHYVNGRMPIVFSGVNKDPSAYGFRGSRNVTGVVEHEHFTESVALLRSIDPRVKRIAAVFDDAPMWSQVIARMKAQAGALGGAEVVAWDTLKTFEDYQRRIAEYPKSVDAIALVGIFHFRDAAGRNVPYEEVLRWTAEHSPLPDLGFWVDRVHYGTLAAVTVSEREQGLAAGRLARAILVDQRAPSSLPMEPTRKGIPVMSLARARKLGLKPSSSVLLSAEVVTKFDWEGK